MLLLSRRLPSVLKLVICKIYSLHGVRLRAGPVMGNTGVGVWTGTVAMGMSGAAGGQQLLSVVPSKSGMRL